MPPKHSNAAVKANQAPAIGQGEEYAKACMAVSEAREAFDHPPTTAQKLDKIGIEAICEQVSECVTLRVIAQSAGVSKGSLITWLSGHADQYARAREAQGDKLAEDLLQIADDGLNDTYVDADGNVKTDQDVIARSRLRVDARKWLAGKMAPKKYGDKLDITADVTVSQLTDEQLMAKAKALADKLGLSVSGAGLNFPLAETPVRVICTRNP